LSAPTQDRISAAPPRCSPDTRPCRESVYPENNREVMPKLRLESEQTMGASLIYASAGCPNNVDNPKQIQLSTCRDLHTSNRISFGRETPNWVHDLRPLSGRRGYLYLGWRRSQASGAVTSRCSGETKRCRQTRSGRSCNYI
jgi:hypothetical protein